MSGSRWIVAAALGVGTLLCANAASANPNWQLVYSEVNNGNAVISLSALSGTRAWAVGITTQGSNQTPAGWQTMDGVNWAPMSLPPGGGGAMDFTIPTQLAFADDNNGWMSGVRVSPATGQLNLIWRTTNGGMVWDQLHQAAAEIKHLQVTTDWAMFAVGGSTLVRTFDGGTFQESQPSIPSGMELEGVHMLSGDCGYLIASTPSDSGAMGSALLWSSDRGETWTTRSENRDFRLRRAWFVSANLGWAVGNRNSEGVLAKTTDGGKTWAVTKAPDHPPFFNETPPVTSCEDVRFFDDQRGVALCLCCTGNCDSEEQTPSYLTAFLRTADGGQTWTIDPDYEPQMSAPPFPEMSKASGMMTMSFPDPNNGFLAGQNNLILRYTAASPEAEAWPPPECTGGGGSGGSGSGGGSSGGSGTSADGDSGSDSGCGCRTANSNQPPATALLLLLGAAALARRRRDSVPGCALS